MRIFVTKTIKVPNKSPVGYYNSDPPASVYELLRFKFIKHIKKCLNKTLCI